MTFETKDSGQRQDFEGGGHRDTEEGKVRYDLVADGPMLTRWAELMTRGAEKYEARNWMKFQDAKAYERARSSAFRHFMQWFYGETDEDHAAAVYFNINAAEEIKGKPKRFAGVPGLEQTAPDGSVWVLGDDGYWRPKPPTFDLTPEEHEALLEDLDGA